MWRSHTHTTIPHPTGTVCIILGVVLVSLRCTIHLCNGGVLCHGGAGGDDDEMCCGCCSVLCPVRMGGRNRRKAAGVAASAVQQPAANSRSMGSSGTRGGEAVVAEECTATWR